MNIVVMYVITGVVAYLLGSINTAIIVSKFYIKSDVRQKGSGNAGMTNMLRNYGAKPAIITCAGDFLKGVLAILFARGVIYAMFGPDVFDPAYIAGICVILGHIYPIYFGFRGGKGMVTTASVLLMINPLMFGIIMVIFLIIVLTSKIVSLGSILCAIIYPFLTFGVLTLQGKPAWLECIFSACLAVLLVFMHRANIKRLLNGTENKFGSKKKKEEAHHG